MMIDAWLAGIPYSSNTTTTLPALCGPHLCAGRATPVCIPNPERHIRPGRHRWSCEVFQDAREDWFSFTFAESRPFTFSITYTRAVMAMRGGSDDTTVLGQPRTSASLFAADDP